MEKSSSSPLRLNRGREGKIECVFSAVPVADVVLQKDGKTLMNFVQDNDIVYKIDSVKDSDKGNYTCIANNSLGMSKPFVINVIVQGEIWCC